MIITLINDKNNNITTWPGGSYASVYHQQVLRSGPYPAWIIVKDQHL